MKVRGIIVLTVLFAMSSLSALAQAAAAPRPAPLPPQPSVVRAPTELFRQLLAMSGPERGSFLAGKTAEQQQRIETKVQEYLSLEADEREARLQALEIRWHMGQLMNLSPTNRTDRLKVVPEPYQSLVRQRLMLWDILPPPLRRDMLDNETVIRLFLQLRVSRRSQEELLAELPADRRKQLQRDFQRWQQLPPERRDQMCRNFEQFFGMSQTDRNNMLSTLSDAERGRMRATLVLFEDLPPAQRERVVEGFRKFKELSPAARQEFLRSAERWQAMSEKDRELWRQIVIRMHSAKLLPPPVPPRPTASVSAESPMFTNR